MLLNWWLYLSGVSVSLNSKSAHSHNWSFLFSGMLVVVMRPQITYKDSFLQTDKVPCSPS
uniref:Uncharacterized protein n=1 Tax=Anguilla anguilla TaxID=7936 RepID=A0A0E9RN78_ANGAN